MVHRCIECPLLLSSMAWLMSSESRSRALVPWLLNQRSSGIWDWAAWAFCCLSLLSWFPAHRLLGHFHCDVFPSHSASTVWVFTKFGFCSAWPPLRGGWAEVASARLHPSHIRYVGRLCNFLISVSPQQRFEMADQCYSLVTAQHFIRQAKKSTPSRCEGGPTPKERPKHYFLYSFLLWLVSWFLILYSRTLWFIHSICNSQRRQWHPTPVLLPGKSHGWRSLVGCSPWGR